MSLSGCSSLFSLSSTSTSRDNDSAAAAPVPPPPPSLHPLPPGRPLLSLSVGGGGEEEPLIQAAECRICQEEDSVKNLEKPCACSGSLKVWILSCSGFQTLCNVSYV